MTALSDGESNACTFVWKIKNISHCCERIESPVFIADAVEGTKWTLYCFPFGYSNQHNVLCCLHREKNCSAPDGIHVNGDIAFLNEDGSVFKPHVYKHLIRKGMVCFMIKEARTKVFGTDKEIFLPDDTLTAQCSFWKINEIPIRPSHVSARTVLKVNQRSFVWKIDNFSSVKPGVINRLRDDLIEFDLVLSEVKGVVKTLDIDILSFNETIKKFTFKVSLMTSAGEKEECGAFQYFAGGLKKGVLPMPLFTKMLMENKALYLPNDQLLLDCEYVSSSGTVSHELWSCGVISPKVTTKVVEKEKSVNPSVLIESLKFLLDDGIFSDVELRTSTKTFPAHKNILSVRSPVFRNMFSHDMKEKNSGHVDISDLEDGTIHRMLQYIYTDTLEDLQFENVYNLYSAADKYQILSLRDRCSSFMKDNLCPTETCDVLVLADRHQDDDLKSAAQDFILKHDKEVFGSQKWKDLMASDIHLAADMMYRKVVFA